MRQVTLRRPISDAAGHTTLATQLLTVGITHGQQLTRAMVGPRVPPSVSMAGFNVKHDTVVRGANVADGISLTGGNLVLEDSIVTGSRTAGGAGYSIKTTADLGLTVTMRRCIIIARSAATKVIAGFGRFQLLAEDCLILGGEDNAYVRPEGTTPVAGEQYAVVFRRCVFGDLMNPGAGHCDNLQVDGGAGGVLADMCHFTSYVLPAGTDPTTATADGSVLGNAAVTCTQQDNNQSQIRRVHLDNCFYDGAGWTVHTAVPAGELQPLDGRIRGGRWGLRHQFGPLTAAPGTELVDNKWGLTGTTSRGVSVHAGDPIPGGGG